MENAETILVIFLSVALAVFLTLGIIVLSFVLKIVKEVEHVTKKAQAMSDKAETFVEQFSAASTPIMLGRMFANIFNRDKKRR
jgi:hypothetical protein